MNSSRSRLGPFSLAVALAMCVAAVIPASAAYRSSRPISADGGRLDQTYLYGELWSGHQHKGVDLPALYGTYVYAIADGTVVEMYEDIPNGTFPRPPDVPVEAVWGNFVLLRHDRAHWDRASSSGSYVYSIYAHLARNSVRPSAGQHVSAGDWIAEVDNTGDSSGNHLHLQVCLNAAADRRLWPSNTLGSTNTSRNPENWLTSFNYGGQNTGTVVGKLTDGNANPVGDRYIWGLSKPTGWGYATSRTYAYTWTNPDDLLVENWATTDVLPGTYHLYAKNESGSVIYADLGWHSVTAGRTTYVGLYPFYLPEVRSNYAGWNTTISVRNKGISAATVTTTYFNGAGYVQGQRNDTLPVNGSVSFTAGATGAAMVVGSQDLSVVAITDNGTEPYAYSAIPHQVSSSGIGAGTTLYVANTLNNYWGWYTNVNVQNTTGASTTVTYQLYSADGSAAGSGTVNLAAWGSGSVPRGPYNGWAKLTSTQPVAGMLDHYRTDPTTGALQYMAYPVAAVPSSTGHMPSLLRQYWSWNSAYLTTNVGDSSVSATTVFRPPATTRNYTLPARNHYQEYLDSGNPPVPVGFVGSGRTTVTSGAGTIVTAAQHSNTGTAMGMHAIQAGSTRVDLPLLRNGVGNWVGALVIQNTHPSTSTSPTITLYNPSGTQVWQGSVSPIAPLNSLEVMRQSNGGPLPNSFEGSVVVTASTNIAVNVQQSIDNDRGYAYAQP